jgi:hypothetical protein
MKFIPTQVKKWVGQNKINGESHLKKLRRELGIEQWEEGKTLRGRIELI